MELMSSLLLCALTALLPLTSGVKGTSEIRRDATKVIETPVSRKTVWLSPKIPSKITVKAVMQTMSADHNCVNCVECMKKAIKSLNNTESINLQRHMPNRGVILNDILESYHQYKTSRRKRETVTKSPKSPKTASKSPTKSKKIHQVSKSKNVTVTKYNIDGQVYAIKIREGNATEKGDVNGKTCQVYSVKKNHPCNSPKADLIFATAKRKTNKRSKKQTKATLTTETPKPTVTPSRSDPRAKELAEPFMTSIEGLYN